MSHDRSRRHQNEAKPAEPLIKRYMDLRMNHPKPERPRNIADKISQGIENMNFQTQDSDGNESSSDSRHSTRGSRSSRRHTSQRSETAKQRLPYPEGDSLIPGDVPDELEYRTAVEANRRAARERRPPTTKPNDTSTSAHGKVHRSPSHSDNSRHQFKTSSQETNTSIPRRSERSKATQVTQSNLSYGSESDSGKRSKTRTNTTNSGARTSKSEQSQELTSRKKTSISTSRNAGDGNGNGSRTIHTPHRDSNREHSKKDRDTRTVPRRQGSELFLGT
ncbi:hypothetical protein sscle_08g068350 [Sclerotinia sclerotiorum 1980 UF-70]|uniref:Uncharacterized protein n=1 Tax=Sclerotinia sclerotiorum (strain ATCC 18683 / 1980 / Ss-1) TaxID=665079 RepID=A0A1D9QAU6_SCLS1|nr:hypothetical protein sscle_08g068350 [Sclerotinia sclerotiorum 1980 UF-70]